MKNAAGTITGGAIAFMKSMFIFSLITWQAVFDTAIITLIGGVCGYVGSEATKWVAKKVRKWVS